MRWSLATLAALLVFSPNSLWGQVYGLELVEKAESKYRKLLVEAPDGNMLFVEMKDGPPRNQSGVFQINARVRYEFWLADQKRPERLAYRLKKGERVVSSRKLVLALSGADITGIKTLMPVESFASLATEYQRRLDHIEALKQARDAAEQGSKAWVEAHVFQLRKLAGLERWLRSCGYRPAADKLSKQVVKESKIVAEDAFEARLKRALASIEKVDTPVDLIDASSIATDGKITFKIMESQHFRIVYWHTHSSRRIQDALKLAEIALESFRNDHVDPYLAEDFVDLIPENIFEEFFFGPDDSTLCNPFFGAYYGLSWGDRRQEGVDIKGRTVFRGLTLPQLEFWRTDRKSSLEGIIIHRLGHSLADWHYDSMGGSISHDWLGEAMAYDLSFQHLGRNDVFCIAMNDPTREYGRGPTQRKQNQPAGGAGFRAQMKNLARENPLPFDKLFLLDLYDLSDSDIAKGWSLWDWLMHTQGVNGEKWLRGFGEIGRMGKDSFLPKLRPSLEWLLDYRDGDAFRFLQEQWQESL